ncbi:MAG: YicC family protein [Phycisphaerae bacterium]|nr:MAG: YicC family protein [Phycisphaerae bacterium]
MVRSMTGYGDASATIDGVHYFVEVRSLNNKYFKATIRLADAFQGLEAEFESRLREKISRGTVTLNARCTDTSAQAAHEINAKALARYAEQVKSIRVEGQALNVDLGALLALPGVLQPPANEEDLLARARGAFFPLVEKAIAGLMAMRQREGAVVAEELRGQLDYIAARLGIVRERAPAVIAEYENRLRQRIAALLADAGLRVEPVDIIREIASYAERTDIAEEIQRLSAHVDQFRELLGSSDARPIGRTLDFLAQEMLREANTIASKSPDAGVSRAAVEIKGAIDRIKEQVQNLE